MDIKHSILVWECFNLIASKLNDIGVVGDQANNDEYDTKNTGKYELIPRIVVFITC